MPKIFLVKIKFARRNLTALKYSYDLLWGKCRLTYDVFVWSRWGVYHNIVAPKRDVTKPTLDPLVLPWELFEKVTRTLSQTFWDSGRCKRGGWILLNPASRFSLFSMFFHPFFSFPHSLLLEPCFGSLPRKFALTWLISFPPFLSVIATFC